MGGKNRLLCLVFKIYFNHNNVLVRSVTCLSCGVEGECLALGPGMEHFSGVSSVEECQDLCWQRRQTCNYFTYYNQSANQGEKWNTSGIPVRQNSEKVKSIILRKTWG